jgi:hypothetical protein
LSLFAVTGGGADMVSWATAPRVKRAKPKVRMVVFIVAGLLG